MEYKGHTYGMNCSPRPPKKASLSVGIHSCRKSGFPPTTLKEETWWDREYDTQRTRDSLIWGEYVSEDKVG